MKPAPVLRLSGITKRFGSLAANDGISLSLDEGEVLALLGENGAGKSTLVSILFGHYVADAGSIEVLGQPLPPGNPRLALAAGIGMVHQHFTLADNLTVLDNVLMGTEPLWWPFSRKGAARTRLLAVAERFGLPVAPEALVGSLSVGERQRVEILKALYRGARILILDEPTAVLSPQESEALFDTLSQMVAQGLSIIFISHKLTEVLRVSHRVAVLRQGKLVAEALSAGTTPAQLAQWMVGHAVNEPERRPTSKVGDTVCELSGVSTPAGVRERLDNVSITLCAGEIVAIAGVSGNGQAALAELLCGVRKASSGLVTLQEAPFPATPAKLAAVGVARIPEDRHAVGVVGDLPVWENAVSERLRSRAFAFGPFVRRGTARQHAQRVIDAFDVRGGGPLTPARSLSGGNMQKLILGRALMSPEGNQTGKQAPSSAEAPDDRSEGPLPSQGSPLGGQRPAQRRSMGVPDDRSEGPLPSKGSPLGGQRPAQRRSVGVPVLVVAHQPTWGLDIGAVSYVQQQLIAARDAGAAVLLISDDLEEVMTMGDRIAVMHHGHLTEALPAEAWTRESIGLAMAGHGETHAA